MASKLKIRLITVALFLLVASAFAGSIAGTLAWYVYDLRASLALKGTSVADAEQIQIGLDAPTEIVAGVTTYKSIAGLENPDDNHICWAKAGKGLKYTSISSYLDQMGYTTNELAPTTSSVFATGDALSLKSSPTTGSTYDENDIAEKSKYVKLPLNFRILSPGNGEEEYVKNEKVWITEFDVSALNAERTAQSNIDQAIRIYVDNGLSDIDDKFIIKPADSVTAANAGEQSIDVAGLLDLNKDGFYERDSETEEHMYGEYTGTATDTTALTDDQEAISNATNINNVADQPANNYNSFWAMHSAGTILNSYQGLTLGKQYYYGANAVIPTLNNAGRLTGGMPVTKTNNTTGIGHADLTIWLEGWDHVVVDEAIGHLFNLGITFQVNSSL